jgi:hypothetical protein
MINAALLAVSAAALVFCWIAAKGLIPEGVFLLESADGAAFGIEPERLDRAEAMYTDMTFRILDDSMLMITVSPYEAVNSYRRAEAAVNTLNAGRYTLYEAGRVPESITEKARTALWGLFMFLLAVAGIALFSVLRCRAREMRIMLESMYAVEFLRLAWKRCLGYAAVILGCTAVAVVLWSLLSFFPLLPISQDGLLVRLWNGLTGVMLLPDHSALRFDLALERLWTINSAANAALAVFCVALVMMAGALMGTRRDNTIHAV